MAMLFTLENRIFDGVRHIYIASVSGNYILGVISLKPEPVKRMYDKVVRKIQNESLHG